MTSAQIQSPTRSLRRGLAVVFVAVFFLSCGPIFVKKASLPGVSFAFWRLWLAAALYSILLWRRSGLMTWAMVRKAAPGGVLFAFDIAAFFSALKMTSVANAAIINALQPALLVLAGAVLFGERPNKTLYFWTVVAMAGVGLSVLGAAEIEGGGRLSGDLLALLAMVLYAGYFIVSKRIRTEMDALAYTASMLVAATIVMTPLAFILAGPPEVPLAIDWIWIAAMVIIPGSGHLLTNWAHEYVPLSLVALLNLLGPGIVAALAWIVLSESLTAVQIVGMVITVAALTLVVLRPRTQKVVA